MVAVPVPQRSAAPWRRLIAATSALLLAIVISRPLAAAPANAAVRDCNHSAYATNVIISSVSEHDLPSGGAGHASLSAADLQALPDSRRLFLHSAEWNELRRSVAMRERRSGLPLRVRGLRDRCCNSRSRTSPARRSLVLVATSVAACGETTTIVKTVTSEDPAPESREVADEEAEAAADLATVGDLLTLTSSGAELKMRLTRVLDPLHGRRVRHRGRRKAVQSLGSSRSRTQARGPIPMR